LPYIFLLVPSLRLDSTEVWFFAATSSALSCVSLQTRERERERERELLKLIITEKKWKAEITRSK